MQYCLEVCNKDEVQKRHLSAMFTPLAQWNFFCLFHRGEFITITAEFTPLNSKTI